MLHILKKQKTKKITLLLPVFLLMLFSLWYISSTVTTEAERIHDDITTTKEINTFEELYGEKYVLVDLTTETVTLHTASNTETLAIVSQGKPGSYYETIGGNYTSKYKEDTHFSSIGHVYMPNSIHIFGNYFIHGIPYYEDGTKVSSTYSGGCIRLSDNDSRKIFNFITKETPILITRGTQEDFLPTGASQTFIHSQEMTDLMVATISLELLKQDETTFSFDGFSTTTRRKMLPELLLKQNREVSSLYADTLGKNAFISAMNEKAKALGMANTFFVDIDTPVQTTEEDLSRFMKYISTYKSYLKNTF